MCPLKVFTFDIMKVAICQLSYFTDKLIRGYGMEFSTRIGKAFHE